MSTSVAVMNIPADKSQLMRVWHTNVEDPLASRQSMVPIPPKPQIQEEDMRVTVENFEAAPTVNRIRVRPKRRRGNDSVSCIQISTFHGFRID